MTSDAPSGDQAGHDEDAFRATTRVSVLNGSNTRTSSPTGVASRRPSGDQST